MSGPTLLNGNDVAELRANRDTVLRDPAKAERRPVLTAVWTGGDRSRVTLGDKSLDVNALGTLGPMSLVLAAMASCEIDVIATHATLMGLPIEGLAIEIRGEFDVRSYLGIGSGPPSGYERVEFTARLRAPSMSDAQLARLAEAIEKSSPVGSTLARAVRVEGRIERA